MRPTSQTTYRFSFGPWNISTGADPFGPAVRQEMEYARKLRAYKELGFDAVKFHGDDIVPADLDWPSTQRGVADVEKIPVLRRPGYGSCGRVRTGSWLRTNWRAPPESCPTCLSG